MRERPILFSGAMVRAILEGRKTQTRRVVRLNDDDLTVAEIGNPPHLPLVYDSTMRVSKNFDNRPPFELQAIFVREGTNSGISVTCPYGVPGDRLWVRETWRESHGGGGQIHYAASVSEYERNEKGPWKPSIHMPRAASRLVLEVKAVRVERMQEISERDAWAEGYKSAREFMDGEWASKHAESNPWVWVVEFERVQP